MVARLALVSLLLAARAFAQTRPPETRSGDWLQILLPVSALTATLVQQDYQGTKEFVYSFLASTATNQVLKNTARKRRPDLTNYHAFPSGHTTAAFSSAAFINRRYGGVWGKVSIGAAVWVAYTRFEQDFHFTTDVLAGGSIALLYNWAIVHPIGTHRVRFVPEIHGGYYGFSLSLVDGEMKEPFEPGFRPGYRYDFAIGASLTQSHTLSAPQEMDLEPFINDVDAAAHGFFTFFLGEKNEHEIALGLVPIEFTEVGAFREPVNFRGTIFQPNTPTAGRYDLIDFRIRYAHNFTPNGPVHLKAGLTASIRDLSVRIRQGDVQQALDDILVLPLVYLAASWRVSRRVSVGAETESIYTGDHRSIDLGAWVRYHVSQHWEIGVGYFWFDRDIRTSGYRDRHTLHRVMLLFTYQW